MEEFKGNPISLEPIKKAKEPITSNVTVKKEKSLFKKFFAQDIRSTSSNIFNDTIIPAVKRTLSDIVKRSIDFMLYGTTNSNNSFTDYRSIGARSINTLSSVSVKQPQQERINYAAQSVNNVYGIDYIEFNDRGEAEEVLFELKKTINDYGMVSVADFYDLISQDHNHTDNKFGWKDLGGAYVQRTMHDRYKIMLPKPIPIE